MKDKITAVLVWGAVGTFFPAAIAGAGMIEFRFENPKKLEIPSNPELRIDHFNIWSGREIQRSQDRFGMRVANVVYSWKIKAVNLTGDKLDVGVVIRLFDRKGGNLATDTRLAELNPKEEKTIHPHPFPQLPEKEWKKVDLRRTQVSIYWGEEIREFYDKRE